ncbi:helix-turn-helix domain-containing protein [Aliiroseovarius sp. F20344]|uniref:helix-turn-helix domain-containing protein n=1 Tax=Aliiroseovarius sp. F20344 TaxID=2926414 RepID=UPI001FF6B7F5|nr:helix-turn-helix domain-containing protein [Aliiroseovarius sp. F20344]MCK0142538.1 helix-turn-helix domain-containing protein [Aliiroseovarius sp. F20344]
MGKSNRKDEGQYVPLPYSQLRSDAWRGLSGASVKLWLELHTRYHGGNNGALTLSYAEAGDALGMGKATVQRAYRELIEHGFLALEREGNWYHRRAHEWRLTTKPMQTARGRAAPTNDWRTFLKAGKEKRGSETEPSAFTVVPFENRSSVAGSKREPVKAVSQGALGSETEH